MEWISVEDRLPEILGDLHNSSDVLTFCVSHGQRNEFGHMNTYLEGETYLGIDCLVKWEDRGIPTFRSDRFYGKVTHWMPLPEPPQHN